jgi:hypothetical protein
MLMFMSISSALFPLDTPKRASPTLVESGGAASPFPPSLAPPATGEREDWRSQSMDRMGCQPLGSSTGV